MFRNFPAVPAVLSFRKTIFFEGSPGKDVGWSPAPRLQTILWAVLTGPRETDWRAL